MAASAASAAIAAIAASAACCVHCGKQGEGFKRCSGCKHSSYCSAECQKAGWRLHKKTCLPLSDVREKVDAADAAEDWREVLKWEGRMEEMMAGQPRAKCWFILNKFKIAHMQGSLSTGSPHHVLSLIRLEERNVDLLGKMERFRDQGEEMCSLADRLFTAGKRQESVWWLERARKVAEAHGFFSVECRACLGLGDESVEDGRHEQGVDLLRNALAASSLSEDEDTWELPVLRSLINALFQTDAIEELEPLVLRHREAVKEESAREGSLEPDGIESFIFSARLHEAHGEPEEAARDVRALLDLLRQNQAAVQDQPFAYQELLGNASSYLEILDPEHGDEELIESVAAELANLSQVMAGMADNSELH